MEALLVLGFVAHASAVWILGDTSVWKWSIAGVLLILGVLGVVALRGRTDSMWALVRGSLLVATLVLVADVTGGASSAFSIWYAAVALAYPITLARRHAVAVPIALPAVYATVALLGSTPIEPTQALTRAAMLAGVAVIALLLGRSALFMRDQVDEVRSRLREAEGVLNAAFATAQTGMAVLDLGGRFVDVNQAMCDLIGAPRSSVLTSSWVRVVHPDDLRRQAGKIEQLVAGEVWSYQAETRFRSRDGRMSWGMLGMSMVGDDAGRPKFLFAHVTNITDRVRAERRVKENELHFRTLFDLAPVPIWEMDLTAARELFAEWERSGMDPVAKVEGDSAAAASLAGAVRVTAVNEAARALFRARDDREFAAAVAAGRLGVDAIAAIAELLRDVVAGTHRTQRSVALSDLERKLHQGRLRLIVPKVEGRPSWERAAAAFADGTGQLMAETQLRRTEERLRTVVGGAPMVVFAVDRAGVFTLLEGKHAESIGLAQGEAVGRSAFELFRDSPTVAGNLRRALRGESFTTADRVGDFVFETRYAPAWEDGTVAGVFGVALDVTERTQAADRLRALVRSKDRFVATVSHELRTPLTAVVGFAQELRDGLDHLEDEDVRSFVELIADQAGEVADLVEDLLVASRMEDEQIPVTPVACDLWEQIDPVLAARRIEKPVATDRSGGPAKVFGDPVRIRQIIRNLLTNADRYGGPDVVATVARVGAMYALSVSDDGDGVAEDERLMIFEPYHRGHRTEGLTESVGLGLAVSRHLARVMGGDLTFVRHNGRSVFTLTLPAV